MKRSGTSALEEVRTLHSSPALDPWCQDALCELGQPGDTLIAIGIFPGYTVQIRAGCSGIPVEFS